MNVAKAIGMRQGEAPASFGCSDGAGAAIVAGGLERRIELIATTKSQMTKITIMRPNFVSGCLRCVEPLWRFILAVSGPSYRGFLCRCE